MDVSSRRCGESKGCRVGSGGLHNWLAVKVVSPAIETSFAGYLAQA